MRRYLRRELGLPSTAYKTDGYWTDGAERWQDRYDALDPLHSGGGRGPRDPS